MVAILILISIILLSWVSNLKDDVKSLKKRLESLEDKFLAREERDFGKSEIILAAKAKETETEVEVKAEKPIIVKTERILTERIINKENKPKENVELRIGRWLNRLGVVAIVIGISFFLKYSFDNNWIGSMGRILIGIMVGIALWGAGEYTKTKYPVYAQGLLGGGSLTVFLSLYAGYSYYNLYSQAAAFIALVVVMGATVAMALRNDSLAIGILGIIGGYVTPFMVSSQTPSPWVLFGYLTVLTLGVLIISIYRQWTIFNHLSFAFNELIILLWMVSYGFSKQFFTPTLIFLIVVFVLYLGISSIYNIRKNKVSSLPEITMVGLNAFFFFAWSYNLLLLSETLLRNYMGFYAVLLALVYIFIGRYAFKFFKTDKKQVIALFGIALVLLTLATPIQFESDFIIAFIWLAEASGLLFIGSLTKINRIKHCSLAVLILGLFAGLDLLDSLYRSVPFFINEATAFMLFAILTTANMWKVFKKEAPKATIPLVLIGLTLIEILVFLTVENFHFFEHYKFDKAYLNPEQLSLSFIWLFYAISLFLWGYRKKNKHFRFVGIGLISVVIAKAFLLDLASLALVYKIILFIIVGLCSLGISFLYQRNKELFNDEERG